MKPWPIILFCSLYVKVRQVSFYALKYQTINLMGKVLYHRQTKQMGSCEKTQTLFWYCLLLGLFPFCLLLVYIVCIISPGVVSELPCTTQKAAASEWLLSGCSDDPDASIAAGRHPLLTVQQPGPTTSTRSARIPGRWVRDSMSVPLVKFVIVEERRQSFV